MTHLLKTGTRSSKMDFIPDEDECDMEAHKPQDVSHIISPSSSKASSGSLPGVSAMWDRDNVNRLVQKKDCKKLIDVLKGAEDALVAKYCSEAMGKLAANFPEDNVTLGKLGACDAIRDAAKKFIENDEESCVQICFAVGRLAWNVDNQTKLGSNGTGKILFDALAKYRVDAKIPTAKLCGAIYNLLLNNPANQTILGNFGACESVAQVLMSKLGFEKDVAWQACAVVQWLAIGNSDNQGRLQAAGCCQAIVSLIKTYNCIADRDLTEKVCAAISELSLNCPNNQDAFGKLDVCEGLQGLLVGKWCTADKDVAEQACKAISALLQSKNDSLMRQFKVVDAVQAVKGCKQNDAKLKALKALGVNRFSRLF